MRFLPVLSVLSISILMAMPAQAGQEEFQDIPLTITAFTAEEIEETISAMGPEDQLRIILEAGQGGLNVVNFPAPQGDPTPSVLDVCDTKRVEILRGPQATLNNVPIIFNGAQAERRFLILHGLGRLSIHGITFEEWNSGGDGGVALVEETGVLEVSDSQFLDNSSTSSGGALAASGSSRVMISDSAFNGNQSNYGGSLSFLGNSTGHVQRSVFVDGQAISFGCDVYHESDGIYRFDAGFVAEGSQFSGGCTQAGWEMPNGAAFSYASGIFYDDEAIHATDWVSSYNSYFGTGQDLPQLMADTEPGGKPEALCEDFGTGAFMSQGYNLSEDNSCGLNQPTDITNTNGQTAVNEHGIYVPQAGSPLIDSGETDALVFPGEILESLPCGYKDLMGLGRPQDANGDGVFECDRGAVEIAGPGALTPGHSAAFFNPLRDGEGQYVEMINADTAVVYTFTHRPNGNGSAWFIGVGDVVGNSIVIDDLLRPAGTSFGSQFDSAEIEIAPAGGQSMVFNDCQAAAPGGNVAFSGDVDLGYEALITRAQRLSNILGCGGSLTPHPNAGLSGSYFLPARDGEGIVAQWLPNGQVLVIFFTYDLNGDQQWVIGIGDSDGFSATMDALYASSNTAWGSDFDPADITLSPWGTFDLTWTGCGGVQFAYNSTVAGYGSATRQYIRLSSLWGANCPTF